MTKKRRSPPELRSMFGSNLRKLAQDYPSISELSRQLGINRTQFNRYLSGESFPRPDVLGRICDFFGLDARILLEPVGIVGRTDDPLSGPFLSEFLGGAFKYVPEDMFRSGFYRFSQRSFIDPNRFVIGLIYVFREEHATFIRGFEARDAMLEQGLPDSKVTREFRGMVLRQEDGVACLVSKRGGMSGTYSYFSKVTSFENNYWLGYTTHTARDRPENQRVVRVVCEHLGINLGRALSAARTCGYCSAAELLPFHQRLLQTDKPFF
ncbi:MAG: helix-turn-helix transcriptional regulator [Tateyamaria sp.]|nr:helix-turn-helix transcriptional regulator [Tateyamaria sp.]